MSEARVDTSVDDEFNDLAYQRRWRGWHPIVLGLATLALFALGFGGFVYVYNQTSDPSSDRVAPAVTSTSTVTTSVSPSTAPTPTPSVVPAAGLPPAPAGAYLEATLNLDAGPGPGLFRLSGRVPDAETAAAVQEAAQRAYAPYVESSLAIDPSLQPAPWLGPGAQLMGLLPTITDGTIRVSDAGVQVLARAPSEADLELFKGALTQLGGGLPVTIVDTTITNLTRPTFSIDVSGGKVTMEGGLPSPAIKALLESSASAAYGQENVTSNLISDPASAPEFSLLALPAVLQLLQPFPQYQIRETKGQVSGSIQAGAGFAIDSTEVSPTLGQLLTIAASIMARNPSIAMNVIGYTDATGPDDHNVALSEARARSVVDYLVATGIAPERLNAVGRGEQDPIAPNTDPEGRALNRRVEFTFGPPTG